MSNRWTPDYLATAAGRDDLKKELERLSALLDPEGHEPFMRTLAEVEAEAAKKRAQNEQDALEMLGEIAGIKHDKEYTNAR